MRKLSFCVLFCLAATLSAQTAPAAGSATGAALYPGVGPGVAITLPAPDTSGGMTLNQALATRRSVRAFNDAPLTDAQVSQLLWAAQGVTSSKGQRTAPSAHAQYYLHLYVARAEGFFEYLPGKHVLQPVSPLDLRAKLTADKAPMVFVIAGEYERAEKTTPAAQADRYVNLEAGHAAQNLVLEATALGLGGVTVGGINPAETATAAALPKGITPIYVIPIGHPAKP
jgi:SagB-type dehydrogenase family enzyme